MCAMCGCNSQEFMGVAMNAPDAQSVDGIAQQIESGSLYGNVLDSMNNLGVGGTLNLTSSQTGE